MELDPIKNDARRERRNARLTRGRGHLAVPETPRCAVCGFSVPDALRVTHRTVLEEHHAAGRAHDKGLTIIICLNCHAVATEYQRIAGADLRAQATFLERLVAMLRSIGSFLGQLGERLLQWAEQLAQFVAGLDRTDRAWRTLAEAQ